MAALIKLQLTSMNISWPRILHCLRMKLLRGSCSWLTWLTLDESHCVFHILLNMPHCEHFIFVCYRVGITLSPCDVRSPSDLWWPSWPCHLVTSCRQVISGDHHDHFTLWRQVARWPLVTIMTISLHSVRFLVTSISSCIFFYAIQLSYSWSPSFPLFASHCFYHIFFHTICSHCVSKVEFIPSDSIHQLCCNVLLLL